MKLLQKWFNYPPYPNAPYVTDANGEKFWISWNEHNGLDVWYRGIPAGQVNLLWNKDGVVTLADIIVFPKFRRGREHRGHGLGKAMMQETIRHVKLHGAKIIWGFIQPHDGSSLEYLIEWYQRQGFHVFDVGEGHYQIAKQLSVANKVD